MAIEAINAPGHTPTPHGASQARENQPSTNTRSAQEDESPTIDQRVQKTERAQQASKEQQESSADSPSMEEVASEVNEFIQIKYSSLRFEVSEEADRTIVSVVDKESGEVIRQMPTEDMVKLYERLQELQEEIDQLTGIFVDNNA